MLVALLMSPLLALIALVAVPPGEGKEPINPFDTPDGVDLAPPHSLLMQHRATMGTP